MSDKVTTGRQSFDDGYFKYGEHVPARVADKLLAALRMMLDRYCHVFSDGDYQQAEAAIRDATQGTV